MSLDIGDSMKFNLEYYRTFFVTANFLNFTKAAKQLYLTQSAVSQTIKKLESELGCALFIRRPSGLRLTREGDILYYHVKKAFEELQAGEYQIHKLGDFKAGMLQIGATETTLRFFLAPLIQKFKKEFPDIYISFTGSTTRDTCKKLSNGDIEFAFLISPIPPEYHFELIKLRTLQDVFFASRDFKIDFSKEYTPSEIIEYPLVSISSDNSVRAYIEKWFMKYNIIFTPEYTVKSTGLVLPLIQNDLGIGILPLDYISDDIRLGKIIQIRMTDLPSSRYVYIATNPLTATSAIGREFYEFTLKNASIF